MLQNAPLDIEKQQQLYPLGPYQCPVLPSDHEGSYKRLQLEGYTEVQVLQVHLEAFTFYWHSYLGTQTSLLD